MANGEIEVKDDTLVCSDCGSEMVQVKQWVWANTNEYAGDVEPGHDDSWCTACETHPKLITHKEYKNQEDGRAIQSLY